MKIVKFYYLFDDADMPPETFETELLSYDEQTKCLNIDSINEQGHKMVTGVPVRNLRKFSVTTLEREL